MSDSGLASKAASAVTATAYIVLAAASVLAVAAVCIVGIRPVQALPSYARQTGQQCAACHNGFPELTPYGRQFKLNGYTWTGGTSNLPPIAAMAIPTFTNVRKGVDGGLVPGFGYNNDFAFTGSLFYGGKIFDGLGTFTQVTYDQVPDRIHWDNIDLAIQFLSGLGMPSPQQQLAFEPVQLRCNQRSPVFSTICNASSNRVTTSSTCPAISHALARSTI